MTTANRTNTNANANSDDANNRYYRRYGRHRHQPRTQQDLEEAIRREEARVRCIPCSDCGTNTRREMNFNGLCGPCHYFRQTNYGDDEDREEEEDHEEPEIEDSDE